MNGIDALVQALKKGDEQWVEAQKVLLELTAEGDTAGIQAELIKAGIVGIDIAKFCAASDMSERLTCVFDLVLKRQNEN